MYVDSVDDSATDKADQGPASVSVPQQRPSVDVGPRRSAKFATAPRVVTAPAGERVHAGEDQRTSPSRSAQPGFKQQPPIADTSWQSSGAVARASSGISRASNTKEPQAPTSSCGPRSDSELLELLLKVC